MKHSESRENQAIQPADDLITGQIHINLLQLQPNVI